MAQRYPEFSEESWIRTCDSCGNRQKSKKPDESKELTNSYRNAKCHKCKSESLDYGTENSIDPDWI